MGKAAGKRKQQEKAKRERWGLWLTYWGTFLGLVGFAYPLMDSHIYIASGLFAIATAQLLGGMWFLVKWPMGVKAVVTLLLVAGFSVAEWQWMGSSPKQIGTPIPAGGGALMQYGLFHRSSLRAVVNTSLLGVTDAYNLLVIVYVVDRSVDEYEDKRIEKSGTFMVDGNIREVVIQPSGQFLSRLANGGEVEFVVAVIPRVLSPTQVTKLNDVPRLGGKLIVIGGMGSIQTEQGTSKPPS